MKPGNRRVCAAVPIPTGFIFCKIRWVIFLLSRRKGFFNVQGTIEVVNESFYR